MGDATTLEGGCHCGAVRFRVRVSQFTLLDCNCSICRRKGYLHLIVDPGSFDLLRGAEHLSTYSFHTRIAKHHFCRICGVSPFYVPRSHPDHVDVNARCLDDGALERFRIEPFDGRNWEENVGSIR